MFTLALRKKFIAHHLASDTSVDNRPTRAHLYTLEVMLETEDLDSAGYVLDMDELEAVLDAIIAEYRDKTLDNAATFADQRPTLEVFARVLGDTIVEELYAPHLTAISVRLWQDDNAWAMYDIEK